MSSPSGLTVSVITGLCGKCFARASALKQMVSPGNGLLPYGHYYLTVNNCQLLERATAIYSCHGVFIKLYIYFSQIPTC